MSRHNAHWLGKWGEGPCSAASESYYTRRMAAPRSSLDADPRWTPAEGRLGSRTASGSPQRRGEKPYGTVA